MIQENSFLFIPLIIIAFIVVFSLMWAGISWLIAQLGGWARLAREYPYQEPLGAECWGWQGAILNIGANYNGSINVCADELGLYFSVIFFFKVGHRPFFVPWEEITAVRKPYFLYQMVEMRFERAPHIPFRIYKRLADKIEAAGAGRWQLVDKEGTA